MSGRKRHIFDKIKVPLIIFYVVIAVIFNCWVISTFMLKSDDPTIIVGTVQSAETEKPVEGAVVGAQQGEGALTSEELITKSDADGRYLLSIPAAYENMQLYCTYGGLSGSIINAPQGRQSGELSDEEQPEWRITSHRKNTVDWEVSTR